MEEEGTTVAPPERDAQSLTSSHFPPLPFISSSRARQEREPIRQECEPITKGKSSDHSNSDSNDEQSSPPSPDHPTIKIGPSVGRCRVMPPKPILSQREGDTDIPMASPDQERVTPTTQLEKAKLKIKGL